MNSKITFSRLFLLLAILTAGCILTANIVAVKLISLNGIFVSGGIVVFPVIYILNDILTEVYGFKRAKYVIWFSFIANLLFVLTVLAVSALPNAPFWNEQKAFDTILGFTPRLLLASFVAYLAGSFANSIVLAKMKLLTKGKYLWTRTIGSTIIGEGLDSLIFVAIAFGGIIPNPAVLNLITTQWILKTSYETIMTPVTYLVVNYLKKKEGLDEYDTSYNLVK